MSECPKKIFIYVDSNFLLFCFYRNAHHLPVKRLTFRPNNSKIQLASCSDDHFVKIFEINL